MDTATFTLTLPLTLTLTQTLTQTQTPTLTLPLTPTRCSPMKYLTYVALDAADSLWGLYLHNVTATQALGGNSSRVVVESTGSLRYDLYAGNVTVNDLVS